MQNDCENLVCVPRWLTKIKSLNKSLSSTWGVRKLNYFLYLEDLYSLPDVYKGMKKIFEAKKGERSD